MSAHHPVLLLVLIAASPAWSPEVSGVPARLRGVSAVNADTVWASGAQGTILRTTDGGRTWKRRSIPGTESLDFRDVDAFSDSLAYVLAIGPGEASRVYKTADGGLSWVLQHTNREPKAFFDAMAFWSAERGIVVSDAVDGKFFLLKTENGGRNWTRIDPRKLPPARPGEGAFAASGTNVAVQGTQQVWIGTSHGRVLHSSDGGETWSITASGLAVSPTAGIFSIAFRDALHGIVTGGDFTKEKQPGDHVALTRDGGRTWHLVKAVPGFRSAAAYGRGALIVTGPSGTELSRDGGEHWEHLAGDGYHAVSALTGEAFAWGVGEQGRIARLNW